MKLIRLTTEDPNAFFDCNFNDGIDIAPNSKIALQSVSASLQGGELVVSSVNNGITYQIKDAVGTPGTGNGGIRTVLLDNVTYNKTNADDLLANIEDKLNDDAIWVGPTSSNYTSGYNKIIGLEWACLQDGGYVNIQYLIAEYSLATPTNFDTAGDDAIVFDSNTWGAAAAAAANPLYTSTAIGDYFLSKGNGFVRAKMTGSLGDGATLDTSGFYIGLSRNRLDNADFTLEEMDYAIRVTKTAADSGKFWVQKLDASNHAVLVPTAEVPSVGFDDIIEVAINGPNVELNIWRTGDVEPTTLATFAYNNTDLYPFICFNGTRANATLTNVRFTASPYDSNALKAPPIPKAASTNNFIRFEAESLSNFLGFPTLRTPVDGFQKVITAEYKGSNVFTTGLGINGFLIQLLNVSVDSYDSLREQRENILAIIPSTDTQGDLNYMASSPIFIDILNKEKLSLRNIRARIVNTDYSLLNMQGFGLISLLIE